MTGRGERGSALVEFSWLALLLVVPLLWAVVAIFEVQKGAFAVTGAARAAGRAYVLAESDAQGRAQARAAADQVLADHDLAGLRYELTITCLPTPADCHAPGSSARVELASRIAVPFVPVIGGEPASVALSARQQFPVGTYTGG